MAFPSEETVAEHGVKTPADFDRESFRQVVAEAHTFCKAVLARDRGEKKTTIHRRAKTA